MSRIDATDRRAGLVVVAVFFVYLRGLLPFVYWADSGELTLGGFELGLAHPPSFPVYALLVKGMSLLPLGDVAFRTSLASAVFGSIAAGGLFVAAKWLFSIPRGSDGAAVSASGSSAAPMSSAPSAVSASGSSALAAAVAVAVYVASPQSWQVSIRQEVYTLNLLVSLGIVASIVLWGQDRRPGRLIAAGFLFGLGLGNHSLLVLALFPPIALFLLGRDWRSTLEPRTLAWTVAAFLLGVSSYLYLPLRSTTAPFLDWNDPERLAGFVETFTKKSERALFVGESGWGANLRTFSAALIDAFTPWLVWLPALGVVPLVRRNPAVALLLVGLAAFNVATVVMAPAYDWENPDVPGYLLVTWAVVALFLGEGARRLAAFASARLPAAAGRWAAALVLVGVAGVAWTTASPRVPGAADDRARAFGIDHLAAAPAGAVVLAKSDPVSFLSWYLQKVEGRRPDVLVLNRKGLGDRYYTAQLEAREPWLFEVPAGPVTLRQSAGVGDEGLSIGKADAIDFTPRLGPEIERLIAVTLPRRPVLWESGSDNRWVLALSRPRGPLFEVTSAPVRLSADDHRASLAFQQVLLARMVDPALPVDPRAGRALEVTVFNLVNALQREEAAPPAIIAGAFGALWRARPGLAAAGLNHAAWLFRAQRFFDAEDVYRRLVDSGLDTPAAWAGLASSQAAHGELDSARESVDAGLARHPGDPMLADTKARIQTALDTQLLRDSRTPPSP